MRVPRWLATRKNELIPPLLGLIIMVLVFGVLNSQFISGKLASRTSIPDPQAVTDVNKQLVKQEADTTEPTIHIPKIGIKAPVSFKADTINESYFQQLLQSGTVHYPNTATPGTKGNSVIFGHSSGRWWAPGEYKFIFSKLDQLETGDKIFIDYSNTRYMYEVVAERIIVPTNLSILDQDTDHQLTLLTCYPVGSNAKRLIITASQVIPDLADTPTTERPKNLKAESLPAQTPSFWDNLMGIF